MVRLSMWLGANGSFLRSLNRRPDSFPHIASVWGAKLPSKASTKLGGLPCVWLHVRIRDVCDRRGGQAGSVRTGPPVATKTCSLMEPSLGLTRGGRWTHHGHGSKQHGSSRQNNTRGRGRGKSSDEKGRTIWCFSWEIWWSQGESNP